MSFNNQVEQAHRAKEALSKLSKDHEELAGEEFLKIVLDEQEVADIILDSLQISNYRLITLYVKNGNLNIAIKKES